MIGCVRPSVRPAVRRGSGPPPYLPRLSSSRVACGVRRVWTVQKSNEPKLALVAMTHDQLEAKLPKLTDAASTVEGKDSVMELKRLLDALSELMDARHAATETVKKTANDVDVIPILLANQKGPKAVEQVV